MTANLTVPADVWACQQPGVPLVAAIVEGVDVLIKDDGGIHTTLPSAQMPAWLVALRDARCETCGGRGRVKGMNHGPADLQFSCPNPRCHAGRLLHDVRVECQGDDPHGWWQASALSGDEKLWHPCPYSCDSGYRTVRCLVDVVKVRRDYTDHGSPAVVVMCEPMVSAGRVFWVAADGSSSVALTPAHVDALAAACGKPPADWVGGYAVILTEVGQ